MYQSVGYFIKSFIMLFLVTILFVNIVYAFDLVTTIGLPNFGTTNPYSTNYEDKYFGISSIIETFKIYYGNENALTGAFNKVQSALLTGLRAVDVKTIFAFKLSTNTSIGSLSTILTALRSIANIFFNLPYFLILVVYFAMFLVYLIFSIIQFVFFFVFLVSNAVNYNLPHTYDSVQEGTRIIGCFVF